ncbi:bifunctional diguanylate cyclase/phosphodiesterase [Ramlibacter sp. MAHUQ-53]|uniref:bifunctional diguanylate cyclase/phosphodiesterase n=1 Tax=unclassified Ramlibacter TaxID=2617605 RepID=UPI00363C7845
MPPPAAFARLIAQRIRHSTLKARLTLFSLVMCLAATLTLGVWGSERLHRDLEHVLSQQQFSVAQITADTLDRQLSERFNALRAVAELDAPYAMGSDVAAQRLLQERPVLQGMFNGGTFITDAQGIAIASMPLSSDRQGVNYGDRDYIQKALKEGKASISQPVIGRALSVPIIAMAVPIYNHQGTVAGALVGVINLVVPSFLDNIQRSAFGKTGGFLLVCPEHRVIVTSSDHSRVMEKLPPPGVNREIDRFIAGFEGTAVLTSPQGIEVLASVKRIPSANWYVAVTLPTDELFEPAHALQRHLIWASLVLAAVTGFVSWRVVRGQLTPLQQAADTLGAITPQQLQDGPLQPLAVKRPDEIGKLIEAFNQLMGELGRQREAVGKSEQMFRTAFRTTPDPIGINRMSDGCFLQVNESFTRVFGWTPEEMVGRTSNDMRLWRHPHERDLMVQALEKTGRCSQFEAELRARDGRAVTVRIAASLMEVDGEPCMLVILQDITAAKTAQAQIDRLAFSDLITGLPNRRLLMDRLAQALPECLRHGQRGALLFVDLNDFQGFNDLHGHAEGDRLLREVAQGLREVLAPGDTLAHLGGDDFVAMLRELAPDREQALAQARATALRVLGRVTRPVRVGEAEHTCGASVGLTVFGDPGDSPEDLFKQADLAMYEAKAAGRNQVRVFEPGMHESLRSRAAIEAGLRGALTTGGLRLHYQPQVDRSGHVVGVEALLRWQDGERGLVSPGEFIPVAEETGLIVPMGAWALDEACRQIAQWGDDPRLAHLVVGVNVSSHQVMDDAFVGQVLEIVGRHGIAPERLKLELTESVLVNDIESVVTKMRQLKDRGLHFSLDDFGTGFSSLAYLKRMPLDELKIDQSFVRDLVQDGQDMAIARTILALGQTLGLEVVAEGVETEAQQELLAGMGCRRFQGYLYSAPAPAAVVEGLVRQRAAEIAAAADAVDAADDWITPAESPPA